MKLTNKKPEGKEKNRYSEEEVDCYTICKICLIRKSIVIYVVNDEVPSTSSQIVEKMEIIQELVLPGISRMND